MRYEAVATDQRNILCPRSGSYPAASPPSPSGHRMTASFESFVLFCLNWLSLEHAFAVEISQLCVVHPSLTPGPLLTARGCSPLHSRLHRNLRRRRGRHFSSVYTHFPAWLDWLSQPTDGRGAPTLSQLWSSFLIRWKSWKGRHVLRERSFSPSRQTLQEKISLTFSPEIERRHTKDQCRWYQLYGN